MSFPRISELPSLVHTTGWQWVRFKSPRFAFKEFWLGTDREGNRWLTKLSGDFRAYREIVFGRLSQQMNWSCQSSVFMKIDSESAEQLGVAAGSVHAAHWFLDEHSNRKCSDACQFAPLIGREIRYVEDLTDCAVECLFDWPKSELAACLFGGSEPPGQLITSSHQFVIIDGEGMFSSGPSTFDCTNWWGQLQSPHLSGVNLARQVCKGFLNLGLTRIWAALELPNGVEVRMHHPIEPLLPKSLSFAQAFNDQ